MAIMTIHSGQAALPGGERGAHPSPTVVKEKGTRGEGDTFGIHLISPA